ncbi:MAG: aminotransferase class I/II-fold pyridoxal phosphate-dependent enzyme [Pseudomonadota bacterium]
MASRFTGSFTQQLPLPEASLLAATEVMRHGRLHRYNVGPGEVAEVALLEEEFAAYTGARYCLAVASGGAAMTLALRAAGVKHGDLVLSNAFTLAPVPGAIAALGAEPVFVEVTEDLTLDLDDLESKIAATRARTLLLSHMRGHICDMDALMTICEAGGVQVIEDCAHTMGARWNGVPSGRHGLAACYSTQTYKHMNSGEGGLLTTDDAELAARAVLLSGSYMLYERHRAAPPPEAFAQLRYELPNISSRMDNLRAAILRPQLLGLEAAVAAWGERYRAVETVLRDAPGVRVIERPEAEHYVGSSIQFLLLDREDAEIEALIAGCGERGVELKWFGAPEPQGFTSVYRHWRYTHATPMPASDRVLHGVLDMRLPLTFSVEDCRLIARIVVEECQRNVSIEMHAGAAE